MNRQARLAGSVENDPSVWTGRALQAANDDLERCWSCASVSGLLMEPLSSWPSWISARARSHSRLGPEGPMGHLITNALARPFLHLLFPTRRPRRESQLLLGDQLEPSTVPLVNLSVFIQIAFVTRVS